MGPETAILVVALAAGFYMAWSIGANDVANAMGTSVGSGALTLGGAIVVAGIFEFGGAVLVGGHVTETVRKGILDPALFGVEGMFGTQGPAVLAIGMAGALLAAAVWLQGASMFGLPVSTTHSIIGAVVGFGVTAVGVEGIDWGTLVRIVSSWVVSPLLGGVIAFGAFWIVRRLVLEKDDPIQATIRISPYLLWIVGTILALTFAFKALSNVISDPHPIVTGLAALGFGGLAAVVGRQFIRAPTEKDAADPYRYVERVFGVLQVVTAAFVAFAHGANDVANAVGPLAAVWGIAEVDFASVPTEIPVPRYLLALGGLGIVIGLATWGYKVIATVGRHITEITPTRGFAAEFGAASTVLIASRLGLPISTTHTLVGAVVGVGFAQGIAALNLRTIRNIVNSWIATLPAAALLSALCFLALRALLL